MSLTSCTVHFTRQPERIVWFSGPLARALHLNGRKTVNIKVGKELVPARLRTIRRSVF
jgi:hypothetical protein